MASKLDQHRRERRPPTEKFQFINFFRSSEKAKKIGQTVFTEGLLSASQDWKMKADLDKRFIFPGEITNTTLRLALVLWLPGKRIVIMIELTVPWETRAQEAQERKRAKYSQLLAECVQLGWKSWCFPVEVRARGFATNSVWQMASALGIRGKKRRELAKDLAAQAERASCWIWLKSGNNEWWSSN